MTHPELSELDFLPHKLAKGAIAQTFAGVWFQTKSRLQPDAVHEIPLSDGDQITLLQNSPTHASDRRVAILLIPGLGSSGHEARLKNLTTHFNIVGNTVFRLNHRGVANGLGKSKGIYHANRWSDIGATVDWILETSKPKALVIIAYSLSASMTLAYLGRSSKQFNNAARAISGIFAISPVFDIGESVRSISSDHFCIFNKIFLSQARKYFLAHECLGDPKLKTAFSKVKTMLDLDRQVISKLAGFNSSEAYYAASSPEPWLSSVATKTFIFTSADDPILGHSAIKDPGNSFITLIRTKRGGHLGFIQGMVNELGSKSWIDSIVVRKTADLLQSYV